MSKLQARAAGLAFSALGALNGSTPPGRGSAWALEGKEGD